MEKEKLYFKSVDDTFCQKLCDFDKEELEEINYTLIEAIPDNNNTEHIWCTYFGEVGEKSECKKSVCYAYKSNSGRGKCIHRGQLYYHGKLVNVKDLKTKQC
ncbi:hypothetical protein [Chishuiella sp.]|uniref:hypothetical protein n=1 Tax=Chishuiella sp. TaxID=1969467 RepID=UPI0028A733F9|nr:hypothetical protein [Chishuiella sp.]